MRSVRERARETSKLSNYRQMHIANTMYASDNDGFSVMSKDNRNPEYSTSHIQKTQKVNPIGSGSWLPMWVSPINDVNVAREAEIFHKSIL